MSPGNSDENQVHDWLQSSKSSLWVGGGEGVYIQRGQWFVAQGHIVIIYAVFT